MDEWSVIQRPDWSPDSLLAPNNEHPYLGPVVIYKLLLAVFGMGSAVPFRLANVVLLVLVAWLVLILVRRRLGPWAGLIAAALLLFMGAAWEALLWPAGMGFIGSTAAGLGAFALLDRDERPRDAVVCGLLVVSLCFSSVGLVFATGVIADVVLRGGAGGARGRLARAWIPAIPVVLYGLWYLGWGRDAESALSVDNLFDTPLYIWNAASSAMSSLLGLVAIDPDNSGAVISEGWGKPLLIAGLIGSALLLAREPRPPSRRLWMLATTALAFWASAGLNTMVGREPGASRYQLIGGTLVILIAAELLRGRRLSRGALSTAALIGALAVVSGIGGLRNGARVLRSADEVTRAELSAVEIAGAQASPALKLTEPVAGTRYVDTITTGPYLDAVEKWGSPVDAPADLLGASEANRARADFLLAIALGVHLEPAAEIPRASRADCEPVAASGEVALPREGIVIEPERNTARVRLRRFASSTTTAEIGKATVPVLLRIPADRSTVPWIAVISGARTLACRPPS